MFASLNKLLKDGERLALAVSGGSDSTALMVAAANAGQKQNITVLSVDHGLRADAASDVVRVGKLAEQLGLRFAALQWQHDGVETGVQEKARTARYDLMTEWCRQNGIKTLITAHTLDDQAETMLMRLARGSGVDGLSGMAARTRWNGIAIVRPLLTVERKQLRHFLRQKNITWSDDPSNENDQFERVRIRAMIDQLGQNGIDKAALALSARRLGRARAALDELADEFMAGNVEVFATGYCQVERDGLETASMETVIRVMGRLIEWAGGRPEPVSMAKLERLCEQLLAGKLQVGDRFVLGGAHLGVRKRHILIGREFGRINPDWQREAEVWDRRFVIEGQGKHVEIAPYGLIIDDDDRVRGDALPYFVACSLPMLRDERGAISVPHLDEAGDDMKKKPIGVVRLARMPKGMA